MSALIIRPARGTFIQRIAGKLQERNQDLRRTELSALAGCRSLAEFAERLTAAVRISLTKSGETPSAAIEVHIVLPNFPQTAPKELRDITIAAAKNKRLIYVPDRGNSRIFVSGNQKGNCDQIYSCRGEEMELIPELLGFTLQGAAIAVPLLNFPEIKDIYDLDPQPIGEIQVVGMITATGPKNFLDERTQLNPLRRLATHAGLVLFNRLLTT